MNRFLLVIILLLGVQLVQAQDDYFDIWEDETQNDSTRAKAYYTYLYLNYMYDDPDSTIILVENLKAFAEKNNDTYSLGLGHFLKANSFKDIGDYLNALKFGEEALNIFEQHPDKLKISQTLSLIGGIYSDQGNNVKALDFIKRSSKIAKEIDNTIQMVNTISLIGDIYTNQEDFNNALSYYKQSLEIAKKDTMSLDYANSLFNIGSIYMRKKDYFNALDNFNKSEVVYRELGEQVGLSNILYEKGGIYEEQGKTTIALELYKESLKLDEDYEIYYNAMIKYYAIGTLYLNMKRFNTARDFCMQSLYLAEEFGIPAIQKDNAECLYEAFKNLGNYVKAVEYNDSYKQLDIMLREEETAMALQQMEFSKQVEADSLKQVEIDLRKEMAYNEDINRKNTNKNIAIGAGILFLILSGASYSRYRYTKKSKNVIEKEKERSENLLLNILPEEIAEELKEKGKADARNFDSVSMLFTDFKGFTQVSEKLSAEDLLEELNICFKAFDLICTKYNIEKIKTIGDAYMAAGGLPVPEEISVKNTVLAALDMQSFISERIEEKKNANDLFFEMRLGIHTGPVVAGIVGVKKFQYDIWGDTVNTAARMESSGEVGKVNISEDTFELIKNDKDFTFEHRGKIEAKGKGEINMYFVTKSAS